VAERELSFPKGHVDNDSCTTMSYILPYMLSNSATALAIFYHRNLFGDGDICRRFVLNSEHDQLR